MCYDILHQHYSFFIIINSLLYLNVFSFLIYIIITHIHNIFLNGVDINIRISYEFEYKSDYLCFLALLLGTC